MTPDRLALYIPSRIGNDGASVPVATAAFVPRDDLFATDVVAAAGGVAPHGHSHPVPTDRATFSVSNGLSVVVDLRSVRPSHIQCLLAALARRPSACGRSAPISTVIDPECGLTLWDQTESALLVGEIWARIRSAGEIDPATAATTPWLYGNKLRLTRFVAAVAETTLPSECPVLDLMSGTGIVARALARQHPIAVNDANPYAALLARTQWVDGSVVDFAAITDRLREPFAENQRRLDRLVEPALNAESAFLHGEIDDDALQRFQAKNIATLPFTSGGSANGVSRLVTERYAGIYFGIAQSIEIDSLRHAIEHAFPLDSAERDLCLSALISACVTCASGPHFAQPAKPKSAKALRGLLERRARSVAWEFELALGRLASREPLRRRLLSATCDGWREALAAFGNTLSGEGGAVYVDPPYSKLQYSRYYHVLNVLLAYDYPPVSGQGRYPPRQSRFSSRFEYQPGMARREMRELIQACAGAGLSTMVSYGDAGFVTIDGLLSDMGAAFPSVEAFTETLRHHSQGRTLASSRAVATEYLVVGRAR